MDVVINSCVSYLTSAVPPLMESLQKAGVNPRNIHIVVGDCDDEKSEKWDETTYVHYVRYKNIDENGLLWASTKTKELSPVFFYTHDTILVGPLFKERCELAQQQITNEKTYAAKLMRVTSMCIGFYTTALLETNVIKNYLSSIQNFDDDKKMYHKRYCEDRLFDTATANGLGVSVLPNTNDPYNNTLERNVRIYNNNTSIPRIKEYYKHPDIYKFKTGTFELKGV